MEIKISQLGNVKILDNFQKIFYSLTGLRVTFVDNEGNFLTSVRGVRPFCLLIKKFQLEHKCRESDTKACKTVKMKTKPLIYQCFAGLTEIVSPIILEGQVVGHVLTGQIRTLKDKLPSFKTFQKYGLAKHQFKLLKKEYEKIPVLNMSQVESAAKMLSEIINYIFKIEYKVLLYEEIEKYTSHSAQIVAKTIKFIQEHYREKFSLQEMARCLHISPFYLSHIFKKVTNFTIPEFRNKVKVEKAVELLKDPGLSIKQIAYEVGFSDEYYFSKVFKYFHNKSPAIFRKKLFTD